MTKIYSQLVNDQKSNNKQLAILIDPEKFDVSNAAHFLQKLPSTTTHLFVGGSTDVNNTISKVVQSLKANTTLPVVLFPGSFEQITNHADALLFLSLLSGDNPEYLIGQQVKAAPILKQTDLEIISTGYILIDGGTASAVARISNTEPISQSKISHIVNVALAGELMGSKCIYLEAGSGALNPVAPEIIKKVKEVLSIPLIVGGGIKTNKQLNEAYTAGANMVVMGTFYES